MSDTQYFINRRKSEDRQRVEHGDACLLLRQWVEELADSDHPVFMQGGHRVSMPAAEGDALGLRRALQPSSETAKLVPIVAGYDDAIDQHSQTALIVRHGKSGLTVETAASGTAGVAGSPLLPAETTVETLIALALNNRRDNFYSASRVKTSVYCVAYHRDGSRMGCRCLAEDV